MAKNLTDYGNYSLEFLTLLRTDEAWDLARAQGSLFCFRIFWKQKVNLFAKGSWLKKGENEKAIS